VATALSLGVVIGGLGVWTLTQEDPGRTVREGDPPGLPRIVAVRTLDPGEIAGEAVSVLTAWAPSRGVENTFDEKAMYWVTPMSHFERAHYLPEDM
jgi:hypothetical protein